MIRALLFILCCLVSMSGVEAKQRRVRTRSFAGGNVVAVSSGYADYVYTPYAGTWNDYFLGSSCAENDFDYTSPVGYADVLPNCSVGDYWDCNQSTTGLTSSALGTLSGKAVVSKSLTSGWRNASSNVPSIADNTDFHIRMIVKWTTYSDEFYQLDPAGASNIRAFTNASGVVTLYFTDSGSSPYTPTSFLTLTPNQWYLIDINYDATQGSNGYPRALVYANGTDVSPAEHTGNQTGFAAGGALDIMTGNTCSGTGSRGVTMLFWGFRAGVNISLADHQRDKTALGL